MIEFKDAKRVVKTKSNHTRATIIFNKDSSSFFAVLVKDGTVLPITQDFTKAKHYYSLPDNDAHDHWHKIGNGRIKSISNNTLKVIKRYWATVKPKQKVVGNVVDGEFVIKYR